MDGARLREEPIARTVAMPALLAGRYRVLRKVGKGGMGEVFQAEHAFIEKQVAIKVLRHDLAGEPEALKRLQREARAASALAHPNIVRVEDFGFAEHGTVYLVMEWLDGETLEQRLERGPLAEAEALVVTAQAAAGLAAAHAQGVIHRDIKPANVFLLRDARGRLRVKVIDFGVARLLGGVGVEQLTRTGIFIGTPHYVAPEQARGEPADARSDVYSVGAMLYHLVTGSVPFHADNVMGVLQQHVTTPPMPPSRRAPGGRVSRELEALILRCMAKRPGDRFQSMAELHRALATLIRGAVTRARRAARVAARRSRLAAVAAAMLALAPAALPLAGGAAAAHVALGAGTDASLQTRAGQGFALALVDTNTPGQGQGAEYLLQLTPTDPTLAAALAAGRVSAELRLRRPSGQRAETTMLAAVAPDGRVTIAAPTCGPRHVEIVFRDGERTLAAGAFDVRLRRGLLMPPC